MKTSVEQAAAMIALVEATAGIILFTTPVINKRIVAVQSVMCTDMSTDMKHLQGDMIFTINKLRKYRTDIKQSRIHIHAT